MIAGVDIIFMCRWFSTFNMLLLSVTKSCLTLHNPMDCSMPGFPEPHHLLEFAHVHVHWIGDAIQPSWPPLGGLINKYSPELPLPLYLFPQRAIAAPCLHRRGLPPPNPIVAGKSTLALMRPLLFSTGSWYTWDLMCALQEWSLCFPESYRIPTNKLQRPSQPDSLGAPHLATRPSG